MFLISAFNLYLVTTYDNYIKLAKKIKFIAPSFHISNSIVIFTGLLMEFFTKNFSFYIHIMSLISILFIVIEAKRYKKMRAITSKQVVLQKEFILFAKKVYIIELVVMGLFVIFYEYIH
jgi:hypothetical protein